MSSPPAPAAPLHATAATPPTPGTIRRAALAASGALLAASVAVQALVGVPHLLDDVRALAARDAGGRPRLVAAVEAGLWLGVAALALSAALVAHALWQSRRAPLATAGALRLVGGTCAAFGVALFVRAGGSPHALGYVAAGALALVGAGPLRPSVR